MYDNYTFGEYCYKRPLTGIQNPPENFQQKMNDLFHGFEFICAYIDAILVFTKGHWVDHVHKLELTPSKLKGKGP